MPKHKKRGQHYRASRTSREASVIGISEKESEREKEPNNNNIREHNDIGSLARRMACLVGWVGKRYDHRARRAPHEVEKTRTTAAVAADRAKERQQERHDDDDEAVREGNWEGDRRVLRSQ